MRQLTSDRGVDLVVDPVGGGAEAVASLDERRAVGKLVIEIRPS